uniref:C2H2-type domain-containing protein n=1 Tax=Nelumbo nucifera TaxID=4432 RepID=A0A822ZH32_NELNU|nr:TPA_asm: hypothetical protein HUJ06_000566 [Nelumbo nucifera]
MLNPETSSCSSNHLEIPQTKRWAYKCFYCGATFLNPHARFKHESRAHQRELSNPYLAIRRAKRQFVARWRCSIADEDDCPPLSSTTSTKHRSKARVSPFNEGQGDEVNSVLDLTLHL